MVATEPRSGPQIAIATRINQGISPLRSKGAKSAPTDDELIASAMKAAPKEVGEHATIVAPDANGGMRTLRKGTT